MTFYISFLIYIPSFGTITWISYSNNHVHWTAWYSWNTVKVGVKHQSIMFIDTPGKCIGMYRMSEYSSFILVNRNIWDLKFLLDINYIMACISFNVFVSTNVLLNSISYYLTERICNDIILFFIFFPFPA
jgi:hypothetical protein